MTASVKPDGKIGARLHALLLRLQTANPCAPTRYEAHDDFGDPREREREQSWNIAFGRYRNAERKRKAE